MKINNNKVEEILENLSTDFDETSEISSGKKERIYNKMMAYHNNSLNKNTMPETKASWLKNFSLVLGGVAIAALAFAVFNFWDHNQKMVVNPEEESKIAENNQELNQAVQLAGEIALVEGNVEIKIEDNWEKVELGLDIKVDDELRTLENSKAIINFDDGSALRLDANTKIEIEQCDNEAIVINQSEGQIYNRVNKGELEYKVNSLETNITALGTAFTVNRNHTDKVIIKVLEAKVKIEEDSKSEELLEGEIAVVDKEAQTIQKDVLEYTELQDDFYKWNKEEDVKLNQPLGVLEEVPPTLSVESPSNNYHTYKDAIEIKGYTEIKSKIYINGNKVETDEGKFIKNVNLTTGKNIIKIKAVNEYEKETLKELIVYKDKKEVEKTDNSETYIPKVGINLSGSEKDGKVYLNWNLSNMESKKGFKVVVNETGNPVYPGDTYHYYTDPNKSSDVWSDLKAGKTYYFRVCEYLGGKCGEYSNQVKISIPNAEVEPEPIQNGSISLNGSEKDSKVYLNWNLSNMTSSKGFKVVVNETGNPVYPGDTYHYYTDPNKSSDVWSDLKAGKTYYFRVCEYLGGACGVYSNQVKITIPDVEPEPIQNGSISLNGSVEGSKVYLNWNLSNMESDRGFKVVVNETGNPVYPGDTYHYYTDPNKSSDVWSDLKAGKTYYFRVCEYLGGACGVYSNQVSFTIE